MSARYLLFAKRADGMPYNSVARFHLGNGAQIYDIHANADTSVNGLAQSSGTMVNYLYDLALCERSHANFVLNSIVAAAKPARVLCTVNSP